MHELSIAQAMVDTACKHARGRRVTVVSVRCGRLRQVVPDALDFMFGLVARETVCEGARLMQQVVPARLRCAPCDHEWEIERPAFRCPRCGGAEVAVRSGEELEVEWIEIEEDAACTA